MAKSTVTGAKQTRDAFRKITSSFGPALNKMGRLALKPMLKAARANAPVDSGELKKALIIRRVKGSPSLTPVHIVRARGRVAGRSHFAEFGRAPGVDGKGGYPGSRFLTRAFEDTKAEQQNIIKKEWPRILAERIAYLKSKGIGKVRIG